MTNRQRLKDHRRIVVKIGTTSLTYPNGRLNLRRIEKICWVLTDLKNRGKEIILVSSGAIAVGSDRLGLAERPRDIAGKQAASAVGQGILIQIYENFFMTYNQKVAQVLLTKDVVEDEIRKRNTRNTFFALLSMNVLPIVNENDTVATDELEFSDNDTLSAYVAQITDAEFLIILSDIDGMYGADPKITPGARLIKEVTDIDEDLERLAGGASGNLGTGGMYTKIAAAKMAAACGIDTVVGRGDDPAILFEMISGAETGTLFVAKKR